MADINQRASDIGQLLTHYHQWRSMVEDYNTETLKVHDVDYNFYDIMRNVDRLTLEQRQAIEYLRLGYDNKDLKQDFDLEMEATDLVTTSALERLAEWSIMEDDES